MSGKGDTRRPEDHAAITANWDRIFGPSTLNQCDGCRRGLPIVNGNHRGPGYDIMGCTADRYPAAEQGWDGEDGG